MLLVAGLLQQWNIVLGAGLVRPESVFAQCFDVTVNTVVISFVFVNYCLNID